MRLPSKSEPNLDAGDEQPPRFSARCWVRIQALPLRSSGHVGRLSLSWLFGNMTSLGLIGIYRVRISDDEMRFIADDVCGSMSEAEEEVAGLVLVEIQVSAADDDFDLGLLHQEGSDQAPWDEKYFSADGSSLVGDGSTKPTARDFRVCFFFHKFDPAREIVSPYGRLIPGPVTEMPERLSKVCIYEHPG